MVSTDFPHITLTNLLKIIENVSKDNKRLTITGDININRFGTYNRIIDYKLQLKLLNIEQV